MYLVIYVIDREPFVLGNFDTKEEARRVMINDFKETYEQNSGMNFDDLQEDEILSGLSGYKTSDNSMGIRIYDNEFDWKIIELQEENKGKKTHTQ